MSDHEGQFTAFTGFRSWPLNVVERSSQGVIIPEATRRRPSMHLTVSRTEPDRLAHLLGVKQEMMEETEQDRTHWLEFIKTYREHQKEHWQDAYAFALQSLDTTPGRVHWRICLEIADAAKRHNLLYIARTFYSFASRLQPLAVQVWLDYAKFEEETGELNRAIRLLDAARALNPFHEVLMIRSLKLLERLGNLDAARRLQATIAVQPLEQVWKTVLEGALIEGRHGSIHASRRILSYLILKMPWYGPVHYEAFRLEDRLGHVDAALERFHQGIRDIPRYGPLWFGAFRLLERLGRVEQARGCLFKSLSSISRELVWKVYVEWAMLEDRAGDHSESRLKLRSAARHCPSNLKWKVWLVGARIEIAAKRMQEARALLSRGLIQAPTKSQSAVFIECSRHYEFSGKSTAASAALQQALLLAPQEWKVCLESILVGVRRGDLDYSIQEAREALLEHPGTGRLWALLIQLLSLHGTETQFDAFKQALQEVPKSGEVWCEGARISMNPTTHLFDLASAHQFLEFAIRFTPQYGDSFIESLRLQWVQGHSEEELEGLRRACINADPNYGALWLQCKPAPLSSSLETFENAKVCVEHDFNQFSDLYAAAIHRASIRTVGEPQDWTMSPERSQQWTHSSLGNLASLYPRVSSLSDVDRFHILYTNASSFHD